MPQRIKRGKRREAMSQKGETAGYLHVPRWQQSVNDRRFPVLILPVLAAVILSFGIHQGAIAAPCPAPFNSIDPVSGYCIPDHFTTPNWANSPPLTKFVDNLAGLTAAGANNLGQYIPIATATVIPATATAPESDYYEIALVEYREQMHSDLPPLNNADKLLATAGGTKLRGYVQEVNGVPVDQPHYLGPLIIAQKDRPIRIKFTNRLSAGSGGDLFIPVDNTIMGSGN